MEKFKDRFKKASEVIQKKANELATLEEGPIDENDFGNTKDNLPEDDDYDVEVQQAQKSESFHHYLLSNKYQDLELLIRGYKKVFNKKTNKWETKRKENHCFTDEEAEHILRLAETHLSPDIKLSYVSMTSYPIKMRMIKKQIDETFYSIADCKYGRYGDSTKQYFMKLYNLNIAMALMTRIEANYSMAIQGSENKHTHSAVKGQESLNNTDRDVSGDRGYY